MQTCWGQRTAKRLQAHGMEEKNTPVTGAVMMDFLRPEFKGYFKDKAALCQEFGLDPVKQLHLYKEPCGGGLLPDELSEALGEALDTLKRFGVSDDAIDGVTKSVTDSTVSAAERAAYLLVKTIVQAALFLAFFLALMLLLRLLTHGLDRLFSLPVLAQLNGLGGAALSLMEGALLIFLIVFLAPRLGVTWFADHAAGTHLLAWFLNNTPRSIIASLT